MAKSSRVGVRRRTLKGGRLTYDGGERNTECVIRNLSDGGARIQVADIRKVPSEFVLTFDADGSQRNCFVRWRRGDSLGVEFIAAKG
jgi:hypothetical protein